MHLVQILLPTADNDGEPFASAMFDALRQDLIDAFGGATLYSRAPAEGFWDAGGGTARDSIVIVEAVVPALDRAWWRERRRQLERDFRQAEVLIRALPMERL